MNIETAGATMWANGIAVLPESYCLEHEVTGSSDHKSKIRRASAALFHFMQGNSDVIGQRVDAINTSGKLVDYGKAPDLTNVKPEFYENFLDVLLHTVPEVENAKIPGTAAPISVPYNPAAYRHNTPFGGLKPNVVKNCIRTLTAMGWIELQAAGREAGGASFSPQVLAKEPLLTFLRDHDLLPPLDDHEITTNYEV